MKFVHFLAAFIAGQAAQALPYDDNEQNNARFVVPGDLPDGVYHVVQREEVIVIRSAHQDSSTFEERSLNNGTDSSEMGAAGSNTGETMTPKCWPEIKIPKKDARDSWDRFKTACTNDDNQWHDEKPISMLAVSGKAISFMCNWGKNPCVMSEILEVEVTSCGKGASILEPENPDNDDTDITYVNAARGDWKRWKRGYGWSLKSMQSELCHKPAGVP